MEFANLLANAAAPGTTGNVAIPPGNAEPQHVSVNGPVAVAAIPDDADATTLDEASQDSGVTDDPEDEDGDRVVSPTVLDRYTDYG